MGIVLRVADLKRSAKKMKQSPPRFVVLSLASLIMSVLIAVAVYTPLAAAILFVALVSGGAIAIGRKEGGWRGFTSFAKAILFDW
jgi:hypothetical protein